MKKNDCELCKGDGGTIVIANEWLRVALVDEPDYPGYVRVIWNDHVREMSELEDEQRQRLMRTVFAVESAQREVLEPLKINLASLGNMTPHLHWHVIARFADDLHYPQPVWGKAQRTPNDGTLQARRALVERLREVIAENVSRIK
ncbi:MAG TPA: HIT family protein [Burkholderiaceae bacterium]|nr:HIT family protein [Burkholderiaceae bacterium]